MAVRAKFYVSRVTKFRSNDSQGQPGFGYEVTMHPVTGGTPEDKAFWQATPSGELRMGVLNASAAEQFQPGEAWYLDFTKADS